ncbi:MAG: hypothetical protein AAF950_15145 [Pseudomonadota bacterium]
MVHSSHLTAVEQTAVEIFFNVSIQSAFGLEDPNVRFAVARQQKDMIGYKGTQILSDVENRSYVADVKDGEVIFEANPPTIPALSRVVCKGGRRKEMIDTVFKGFIAADYITYQDLGALPAQVGRPLPEGAGNRAVRLFTNPDLKLQHDVLVVFSWGTSSEPDVTMEFLAWPIDKAAGTP